ncbi:MAG: hypothetical protein ACI9T7_000131 [Oleiphilaceae bacterium]|jgi:hypothetical protein
MSEIQTIRSEELWKAINNFLYSSVKSPITINPMLSTFLTRCEKQNWGYETMNDGISIRILPAKKS